MEKTVDLVPGAKEVLEVAVGDRTLQLVESAEVLAGKADKYFAITDQPHAELTAEFRARLKKSIDELDADRLDMGKGARETLERINSRFNARIVPMRDLLKKVDAGLVDWQRRQREQAEAERRAAEEANRRAIEEAQETGAPVATVVEVAPTVVPRTIIGSHGSKTGVREVWKWRVVEFGRVPKKYRKPPEECVEARLLNAEASAHKGDAKVPGIEFFKDEVITSRVVS